MIPKRRKRNTLFLPSIQGDGKPHNARVPFGYAIYGQPGTKMYKDKLLAGELCLNWYARESDLAFANHIPYVWGPPVSAFLNKPGELARLAKAYPGRYWLLCNEPDYPGQLDLPPWEVIPLVNEWIKAIGDNGIVCGYGTTMLGSPGTRTGCENWRRGKGTYWTDWLGTFYKLGGALPQVAHIHIYAPDWKTWLQRYTWWQEWNSNHGNLPTIISEAGSTPEVFAKLQDWRPAEKVIAVYWFTNFDPNEQPYLP